MLMIKINLKFIMINIDYFKAKNGYEIEGLWYPRVTSICKVIAKPGLERWLAKQGGLAAMSETRKNITRFGSRVHDSIEKILMGEDPIIDESIKPSISAFLDWYQNRKVKALDVERRIVSRKHIYAGNIDVLAEIEGKFGILDIKTSDKVWDDHFIQTAAYFQAYNEGNLRRAETYWILIVDQYKECIYCGAKARDKGGEMEVKEGADFCQHQWKEFSGVCELNEVKDHDFYLEVFLTAKKLWELTNRDILKQIENYAGHIK